MVSHVRRLSADQHSIHNFVSTSSGLDDFVSLQLMTFDVGCPCQWCSIEDIGFGVTRRIAHMREGNQVVAFLIQGSGVTVAEARLKLVEMPLRVSVEQRDLLVDHVHGMGAERQDVRAAILTSQPEWQGCEDTAIDSTPVAVGRGSVDGDRQPGRGAQRFLKISDRIEAIRHDCLEIVNKGNGNVQRHWRADNALIVERLNPGEDIEGVSKVEYRFAVECVTKINELGGT